MYEKRRKTMIHFLLRIFIVLMIFQSSNLFAVYDCYPEDLEKSKKVPLIASTSLIPAEENDLKAISTGHKAGLTVCTVPLKNSHFKLKHVAVVFEMQDPLKDEINLCAVHFGGDGYSELAQKGCPNIDNARDTLRKMYRGKFSSYLDQQEETIPPIYAKEITFVVSIKVARKALQNAENDTTLRYWIGGQLLGYNCCTYVNKVLKDAKIEIGFDAWYLGFKTADYLVKCCKNYKEKLTKETGKSKRGLISEKIKKR